jgi:hypothetical protein
MAVALVAHSYDTKNELRKVPAELEQVIATLQGTTCAVEPLPRVTKKSLENRLALLQKDLIILHFAGHADKLEIQVNEQDGSVTYTDMSRFSEIIGLNKEVLRLVFLNACSTGPQVDFLLNQGIPAVIATNMPLSDKYGFEFATIFYEKFTNPGFNLSLQQAFDHTVVSMESSSQTKVFSPIDDDIANPYTIHPAAIDKVRASLKNKKLTKGPVYQLRGDPQVLNQRFADWLQGVEKPAQLISNEKPAPAVDVSWKDSWLLCDRDNQHGEFKTKMEAKQAGNPADPLFLFIHDEDQNCPFELALRYKQLSLPKLFGGEIRAEDLEYPTEDEFGAVGDRNKPLLQLSKYYWEKFSKDKGKGFNEQAKRYEFLKFPNSLPLVAHHELPSYFWKDSINDFFEYYLGDFSTILRQELSERLLVICTLGHSGTEYEAGNVEKYKELFCKLKTQYPDRILEQTQLPPVYQPQISAWHKAQFKESVDPTVCDLSTLPNTMPFVTAREIMKNILKHRFAGT